MKDKPYYNRLFYKQMFGLNNVNRCIEVLNFDCVHFFRSKALLAIRAGGFFQEHLQDLLKEKQRRSTCIECRIVNS